MSTVVPWPVSAADEPQLRRLAGRFRGFVSADPGLHVFGKIAFVYPGHGGQRPRMALFDAALAAGRPALAPVRLDLVALRAQAAAVVLGHDHASAVAPGRVR